MSSLLIVVLLFASLFAISFVTKRRFGVLGLALAAGALLSMHWANTLTPFLEQQGIVVSVPPLSALVQIALILVPALVLMFSGPTYTKTSARIGGGLAFAALAITFLVDILRAILVVDGPSAEVLQFMHDNKSVLVVAGLVIALIDVLFTRKPKSSGGKKSSSH
jgi:hypothetical protein